MKEKNLGRLNAPNKVERLKGLRKLLILYDTGALDEPITGINVNNHIHTTFSFSPYSPTKAVYHSWDSGLATTGIMDHDSVGGAEEFIAAGKAIGMPVTVGFEMRCSLAGTPFEGKRINNPDQKSVAYLAMHGIPHHMLGEADKFLAPYREKRNIRNWKMVDKLNTELKSYGIKLDFTNDVLPLSEYSSGGSVTERHILFALAAKFTEKDLPRHFLLNMFKSQLVERFYVEANEELPHITDFVALSKKLGSIPAYAYLGDVGISVTFDKKTQKFEDSFLDELITYIAEIGMRAVTYMPARNNAKQLSRIKALCEEHNLFQISGEDINSPMQSFICEKIVTPEFRHLIDSAWALIGHEIAAGRDLSEGMFSPETIKRLPNLGDRIEHFVEIAQKQHKRGKRKQ